MGRNCAEWPRGRNFVVGSFCSNGGLEGQISILGQARHFVRFFAPPPSFSPQHRPGVPFCVGTGSPEACPSEKRFPHRPTQKGSQTRAKFVIRPLQGRTDRWVSIRGRRAQKACPCPRLLNLNPFGVRNRFVSSRLAHPRCSAEGSEHAQPRDRGLQFASRLNPES